MRKALITFTVLFAMMAAGLSAKAQEITITLLPGCTWISYTRAEAMSITTALGDFVPMEGDVIKSQYASTTYNHGRWMGRLQQFTPGLGYMYISRRGEPVSFFFANSIPQSQVTVTTSEPLLITAVSAMGGGEVITDDGIFILDKGLCWATHENPTTNDDSFVDAGSGVGSFSASMTGLNIGTTYYVRAYAVTANGTVYGNQKLFTTRDGIPEVSTDSVTNIGSFGATCGGTVTDDGGLDVIARGVCWSTNTNPTVSDSHTTDGSGLGAFTSHITGTHNTTYYVRAYASTSQGVAYGEEVNFTTHDGTPFVTTDSVTNILVGRATCGGHVTLTDGDFGFDVAIGLCWSTTTNPTISDNHTCHYSDYYDYYYFTDFISGLTSNTTYYVRAYASNSYGTGYGNEVCFTTQDGGNHGYVDLGLPSGLLWATCNVGANSPEDYGDFYAWGECQPKDCYDLLSYWDYYEGWNEEDGYYAGFRKYYEEQEDDPITLFPEDDVAVVDWGAEYRMPTKEEWQELYQNTTHTWTTRNGVKGSLFTASNGNSLFLPAAGYRHENSHSDAGSRGYYWSSSLYMGDDYSAWRFSFYSGSCYMIKGDCCYGRTIRPVLRPLYVINAIANSVEGGDVSGGGDYLEHTICTVSAIANDGYVFMGWTENGEMVSMKSSYSFTVDRHRNLVANFVSGEHVYVDLDLPSGTMWATCNIGADFPEDYGDYFAWGETQPKDIYNWDSYQYSNGGFYNWGDFTPYLTKYCSNSSYGYNGFTDNLTTLLPEDDAATANWGTYWRMPTDNEWRELYNNTTCTWTTQNGVDGRLFTASNGNSLFLPAAGYCEDSNFDLAGIYGHYWSSSLYSSRSVYACALCFDSGGYRRVNEIRFLGFTVRPVRSSRQN